MRRTDQKAPHRLHYRNSIASVDCDFGLLLARIVPGEHVHIVSAHLFGKTYLRLGRVWARESITNYLDLSEQEEETTDERFSPL